MIHFFAETEESVQELSSPEPDNVVTETEKSANETEEEEEVTQNVDVEKEVQEGL